MPITREFLVFAATVLAWFAYAMAVGQPDMVSPLALAIARTAAFVLSAVVVVRVLGVAVIGLVVEGSWGIRATSLVKLVVYLGLGLLAAALVLNYALSVDIATLLTTSALLTAILGLAMQSTLAGLFAGLAIQLEHQLRPGDAIGIEGAFATVEAMGWRSITLRRRDHSLVMLPNAYLAGREIAIRRPGAAVITEMLLPGPLSVPPAVVADIIEEAVADIPGVCAELPISAQLSGLAAQSGHAEYRLRFFTREMALDDNPLATTARLRIWYAYQRHGIATLQPPPAPDSATPAPLTALRPDHAKAPLDRVIAALAATRRWQGAGAEEHRRLAGEVAVLLYAPAESIRLPRGLDRAVVVVVAGEVCLRGDRQPSVDWLEPPSAATADAGAIASWDAEALLAVESRLGRAIGPYGRLAVRRAARETADLAELYRALAPLIKDAAAREEFLSGAPQQAASDFGPGTVLTLARLPRGQRPPLAAQGQVELLALCDEALSGSRPTASAASA